MRSRFASILALCILLLVIAPIAIAEELQESKHMIPMRDGTKLSTSVIRPKDQAKPLPVIFARGPYGKFTIGMAQGFCNKGYVLVSQDMRGRFNSKGSDAIAFHNGGWNKNRDGHDSLEWIAKQEWCDGNIATWGGSALGITQNMLAVDAPKSLKAQFVMVAFSDMYSQGTYQGGVWRKALMETWLLSQKFDPKSLKTFLAHPNYDSFWEELNPAAQAHRVHSPAIFYGGWYDIFLQGTIDSFTTIHGKGTGNARGNCRLLIGPYAHGVFNELKYPDNSTMQNAPKAAEAFRFFDHWTKGEKNGVADDKTVHYYVMGDPEDKNAPGNFWRAADSWPPPATETVFYFHKDGTLSNAPSTSSTSMLSYKYDPENPVATVGGQNLVLPKGPMDQRKVESRDDVLLFTSDELHQPVEVTGRIKAKLYVSSDCPDTDFTAKLTDVYPDGRSMLVTDGILRARHYKGFDREDFLEEGNIYELEVDLWSTSLIFNKGHRIRIAISSSNAPRFDPNPNTGVPFRANSKTRIANNTIHLSSSHPSQIVLPIYAGASNEATAQTSDSLSLGQGIMAGEATSASVILQTRLTQGDKLIDGDLPGVSGVVRFEIATSDDFKDAITTPPRTAVGDSDFIIKEAVNSLKPNTKYYYRAHFGPSENELTKSDIGTFRTLAGADTSTEVSFVVTTGMNYSAFHYGKKRKNGKLTGGYTKPDKLLGYPSLVTMKKMQPDFFVATGDNVYYDSREKPHSQSPAELRSKWHEQLYQPRFKDLFLNVPTYWEKDDHDHRYNDCDTVGDRLPSSELGIKTFVEQIPIVANEATDRKTYRTHRVNKHLQIWLVEGRDYRSPNKMTDGPNKTLWGAKQLAWLKRTLKESDADFKILISPTPMVGPDDAYKIDNHTNPRGFRHEGRAFFQWIKDNKLDQKGFCVVCGDRHWQYHSADPTGIEEYSCGALVDPNARIGRSPGDPKSTDPDAQVKQFYTQTVASGGFLKVTVHPVKDNKPATATFEFVDEHGELLYKHERPSTHGN